MIKNTNYKNKLCSKIKLKMAKMNLKLIKHSNCVYHFSQVKHFSLVKWSNYKKMLLLFLICILIASYCKLLYC
jgi:hypothetical protein